MLRFAWLGFIALGFPFASCALAQTDGTQPTASPSYILTWRDDRFPDLQVVARIPVVDGIIRTSRFWETFFDSPRGWASFVEIQSAVDASGKILRVHNGDANTWQVGVKHTGVVTIHYSVDYSFASELWPMGNEQVALNVDGGLYTTGLPIFLFGVDPEDVQVQVNVPAEWSVATAWPEIGQNLYAVADLDHLTRNTIAVGQFHREVFRAGSFEMRLALLGEVGESAATIRETFAAIFDYYQALYSAEESAQFMIAVIPGPNDGEAYFDSFGAAMPEPPSQLDLPVWANLLAHEFGHYWNGKRFSSTFENSDERQWFSEGGTEYIANQALRDSGLMDEVAYSQAMSRYLSMHLLFSQNPRFDGITIREAGASKWENRPGVYDSGTAAAYCLDGLIRHYSDHTRSIADLMRLMNRRFGDTGTPYVFEDIVTAASEAAGADLSSFFEAHITGDTALPVVECAQLMGDVATVDGYHVNLKPANTR